MHKVIVIAGLLSILGLGIPLAADSTQSAPVENTPLIPEAGAATTTSSGPAITPIPAAQKISSTAAMRLSIPSIALNSPIIPVGLSAEGEMAVPSGSTNQVGWYKYGTTPGEEGSAVLDAHVFAAFAHLDRLRVGSDIYITQGDSTVHFVVTATKNYKLSDMDLSVAQSIFNQTGGRYLNLITCAGQLTEDHSTYDHRLVIRATLAN